MGGWRERGYGLDEVLSVYDTQRFPTQDIRIQRGIWNSVLVRMRLLFEVLRH